MTRHLIKDYRNLAGEHCGSTAMRNLLYHYGGLELAEEAVFGLGSGIDCLFLESEDMEPSALLLGRLSLSRLPGFRGPLPLAPIRARWL